MGSSELSAIAFCMLFPVGGVLLIRQGIRSRRRHRRASTWPSVDATLDKCEVVTVIGTPTRHHIAVEYRYRVAGVHYTGNVFSLPPVMSPDWRAIEQQHRDVTGMQRFSVRYDPEAPAMSTVRVLESSGTAVHFITGGALLLFGIFIFTLALIDEGFL